MAPKLKIDRRLVAVGFRLPASIIAHLDRIARKQEVGRSYVARVLLAKVLKRMECAQ